MGRGFFEDMHRLFGGIRFRYMSLCKVEETGFLLRACANTLQVLQLHPTDSLYMHPLPRYDLSRNKTLHTLEVPVEHIDYALREGSPGDASKILKYALSTIKSPEFSRVAVIHRQPDPRTRALRPPLRFFPEQAVPITRLESGGRGRRFPSAITRLGVEEEEHNRFALLRELHAVRDFQLVLRVDIRKNWEYYMVPLLNECVAAGRARGEFSDLFPEPLVTFTFP